MVPISSKIKIFNLSLTKSVPYQKLHEHFSEKFNKIKTLHYPVHQYCKVQSKITQYKKNKKNMALLRGEESQLRPTSRCPMVEYQKRTHVPL